MADASDPAQRWNAVGGGGARPPNLAQGPPQTASATSPGLLPQSDSIPRSLQPITGGPPPELPLIGFVHPGHYPHGFTPGALTETAHLATGYEPKANAPALLLTGAPPPQALQAYGPQAQRRRVQVGGPVQATQTSQSGVLRMHPSHYFVGTPGVTPVHTPPATGYQTPVDYEAFGIPPPRNILGQLTQQLQNLTSRILGPGEPPRPRAPTNPGRRSTSRSSTAFAYCSGELGIAT